MPQRLRHASTDELSPHELATIRQLLDAAFGMDAGFTDEDWQHALGGFHVLLEDEAGLIGHAAVVERELRIDNAPVRTGYVEAVATDPRFQRQGIGSRLMESINRYIREEFALGALSTGRPQFYERLGWLRWLGPTYVRTAASLIRTAEDDGGVLVLPTPASPPLDLTAAISCDWRPGDVW